MGNTPNKKHGVSYLEIDQLDKTNTDYKYVDGSEKKEQLTVLQIIAQTYFGINANELKEKYDTDGLVEFYIIHDCSKALEIFTEKKNYFMLGNLYRYSEYIGKNYATAMKYYQQAVNADCSYALIRIGDMYNEGQGVDVDYTKAMNYYQQAVTLGNSNASVAIGTMYKEGHGVNADHATAMSYYQQAVTLDNSRALVRIGNMYKDGHGVDADYNTAMVYYQQAITMGCITSIKQLRTAQERIKYYQTFADVGYYDMLVIMGHDKYNNKNMNEAFSCYQRAAELGLSNGLAELGDMYRNGHGVKQDEYKAIEYFQQAIAMGNVRAQKYFNDISANVIANYENHNKQNRLEEKINKMQQTVNNLERVGTSLEKKINILTDKLDNFTQQLTTLASRFSESMQQSEEKFNKFIEQFSSNTTLIIE